MDGQRSQIRVLLIDDHKTIHDEIGSLLRILDNMILVAEGYNGAEGVQLCEQHAPDIVLMDISMPVMNGIEATRLILSHQPAIRVIALTGLDDLKTVQQMVAAGAVGYIVKDAQPEEIATVIQSVYDGNSVFSTDVIKPLLDLTPTATDTPRDYGLTRRELDVLRAMGNGLNNGQVAESLNISTPTVRFHITNIIEKLGAANRTDALIIAVRRNLI